MDAKDAFVLDGSITMVWGFEDEADDYAEAILGRMPDLQAHVPSLWSLEVANARWSVNAAAASRRPTRHGFWRSSLPSRSPSTRRRSPMPGPIPCTWPGRITFLPMTPLTWSWRSGLACRSRPRTVSSRRPPKRWVYRSLKWLEIIMAIRLDDFVAKLPEERRQAIRKRTAELIAEEARLRQSSEQRREENDDGPKYR